MRQDAPHAEAISSYDIDESSSYYGSPMCVTHMTMWDTGTASRTLRAWRLSADPCEVDEGEGGKDSEDKRLSAMEPEP